MAESESTWKLEGNQPHVMDSICLEIRKNLQLCLKRLSDASTTGQVGVAESQDLVFMRLVTYIDDSLQELDDDPTAGALLVLHRRTMMTTDNIEVLCKIIEGKNW